MKTYTGGCHCGKVRYEADIELGTVLECNCSFCGKKGSLLSFIPASQFRLKTDESELTEYKFNKMVISHLFCPVCGVQSYGRGRGNDGKDTVAINVRCLDGVEVEELPRHKYDGRSA